MPAPCCEIKRRQKVESSSTLAGTPTGASLTIAIMIAAKMSADPRKIKSKNIVALLRRGNAGPFTTNGPWRIQWFAESHPQALNIYVGTDNPLSQNRIIIDRSSTNVNYPIIDACEVN
jgi:hypothetical protein